MWCTSATTKTWCVGLVPHCPSLLPYGTFSRRLRSGALQDLVTGARATLSPVGWVLPAERKSESRIWARPRRHLCVWGAGKSGNFLRQMEEEWCTLMFFAEYKGRRSRPRLWIINEITTAHTALCPCSHVQAMRRAHLLGGALENVT